MGPLRALPRAGWTWLLFIVLLGATSVPGNEVQDEWYVHYHRAGRAIDRSDWEQATQELDAAIALRPRSSRNARTYGMRFVRYFPYFLKGVASFGLGQDDEAVESLRMELEEGEIQRSDAFSERIRVLMDAIEGRGESARTDQMSRNHLTELLAEGRRQEEEGNFLQAVEVFERVLALDPENPGAEEALRNIRMRALQEELESFQIMDRGPGEESAEPGGEPPEAAEVRILESKAREIYQRGMALMAGGDLEGALTRFELTLALLEDEQWTSRRLFEDALEHKELVAAEVRRALESELRARLAEEEGLPETPPEIMLISPSSVDEPLGTELVRVQGVAHDNHGVSDVAIIVNGEEWGEAQIGMRRRGLVVSARPSGQDDKGLGTFAQFSKDLVLTETRNQVVVRARNVNGQQTELELEIRVEAEDSRIFAAVIGVGEYPDPAIPDLQYSVADATAFRDYLTLDLGVPESQVFTLIGPDATFQSMRRLFRTELRRQARENDQIIIYFAGHGAPDEFGDVEDGDGVEKYFLPYDADAGDISGTGYPMEDLAESLGRLPATRVVYIADACFSGASGGRTFGHGTTISDGFLGRLSGASPGRVIISASGANEPSLESDALGHGIFTYFLLDGLRGGADADGNSVITIPEIFSYVSRTVPENTGRRQHPTMSGALGGEMVLGRAAERTNNDRP